MTRNLKTFTLEIKIHFDWVLNSLPMSKIVTRVDLEESKNRDDKWLVIHGLVYNVANFLQQHPGGVEILEENLGKDCSVEFDDIGHSKWATDIMETLLIGTYQP